MIDSKVITRNISHALTRSNAETLNVLNSLSVTDNIKYSTYILNDPGVLAAQWIEQPIGVTRPSSSQEF